MGKVICNKNVSNPNDAYNMFSKDDAKFGEIVICNNINEPGIYICTKDDYELISIKKINDTSNCFLEDNINPSVVGNVVSGDSLTTIISKLQNQINDLNNKISLLLSK